MAIKDAAAYNFAAGAIFPQILFSVISAFNFRFNLYGCACRHKLNLFNAIVEKSGASPQHDEKQIKKSSMCMHSGYRRFGIGHESGSILRDPTKQ